MKRDEVITVLRSHESDLRRRGIRHAALFGSVARDTATASSDIDILIELDPDAPIGVFGYVALKRFIADMFSGPVDVVDRDALKSSIRHNAVSDAIHAF